VLNSSILLLTSTISPQDWHFVGRKGIDEREEDYFLALSFYSKFNLPIVFIDNSGHFSKRINSVISNISESEYLTFLSNHSNKGKGHGELEIIKYAFENSKLINKYDNIIKISGRYIISNFIHFLSNLTFNNKIHCCNYSRRFSWVDTRIMILDHYFINNYLFPTMDKFLDEPSSIFFERVYARSIHLFQYDGGKILLWPTYPFYNAINGENGRSIKFSFFKKIKYRLFYNVKKFVFSQTI
tara:strand:- start:17910 stop:18632 length:723 start_codon:yes stop_codon:yes gene_type:complete